MMPFRMAADHPDLPAALRLMQVAFAPMQGRVYPPSSIHRLTLAALRDHAERGGLWAIGTPPAAVLIATPQADALYLGKLAVDPARRRQGLARALMRRMEDEARALGLERLRLETRVELVENHATFRTLGFVETARTAHPGFDRPTTLAFERALPPADHGGTLRAASDRHG